MVKGFEIINVRKLEVSVQTFIIRILGSQREPYAWCRTNNREIKKQAIENIA